MTRSAPSARHAAEVPDPGRRSCPELLVRRSRRACTASPGGCRAWARPTATSASARRATGRTPGRCAGLVRGRGRSRPPRHPGPGPRRDGVRVAARRRRAGRPARLDAVGYGDALITDAPDVGADDAPRRLPADPPRRSRPARGGGGPRRLARHRRRRRGATVAAMRAAFGSDRPGCWPTSARRSAPAATKSATRCRRLARPAPTWAISHEPPSARRAETPLRPCRARTPPAARAGSRRRSTSRSRTSARGPTATLVLASRARAERRPRGRAHRAVVGTP